MLLFPQSPQKQGLKSYLGCIAAVPGKLCSSRQGGHCGVPGTGVPSLASLENSAFPERAQFCKMVERVTPSMGGSYQQGENVWTVI